MGISNLYEEYALLESQIAALETKKDQLRPHILQMMIDNGTEKVETSVGKFSVSKRKVWTYPEAVTELGEKFKEAKATAESTGDATFEEVDQLRFTIAKI
jgi:phage shock protein A